MKICSSWKIVEKQFFLIKTKHQAIVSLKNLFWIIYFSFFSYKINYGEKGSPGGSGGKGGDGGLGGSGGHAGRVLFQAKQRALAFDRVESLDRSNEHGEDGKPGKGGQGGTGGRDGTDSIYYRPGGWSFNKAKTDRGYFIVDEAKCSFWSGTKVKYREKSYVPKGENGITGENGKTADSMLHQGAVRNKATGKEANRNRLVNEATHHFSQINSSKTTEKMEEIANVISETATLLTDQMTDLTEERESKVEIRVSQSYQLIQIFDLQICSICNQ